MSSNKSLIEIKILKYKEVRTLMYNNPARHLEEVPFGNFQLELNLVDEMYNYSESAGYSKCYAAFINNKYVGYIIIMASEMLHHKGTIQAVTDSFYVIPEARGAGVFKALLDYIEQDLRANNIRFLTIGMNPNMPHVDKMKQFVHDLGYMHTEYLVTKEL